MVRSLRWMVLCLSVVWWTSCATAPTVDERAAGPRWEPWSQAAFDRASQEDRLVLLHLGAVWCHWCHVMEERTYRDPEVLAILDRSFVTVHVDQDSRPDLANRYEDYGWPATIVFDAEGNELIKRRGYVPPEAMQALLTALAECPTELRASGSCTAAEDAPHVRAEAANGEPSTHRLREAQRASLQTRMDQTWDRDQASWGRPQKFMRWDCVDYALRRAAEDAPTADGMPSHRDQAQATLDAQLRLIDPVWGGVYQYSTRSTWTHPHFEKLASYQAANLRTFARAWAQLRQERHRDAGALIVRYLDATLRDPDTGAFYVSQDADVVPGEHAGEFFALDDAGRRAIGVPRVDTHRYARENGWIIEALARWYAATGDDHALDLALTAARWVLAHRALPDGGFRHDEHDVAGPYLADTLAVGRAALALYEVTADRTWLEVSSSAARFIGRHFRRDGVAGLLTAAPPDRPSAATPLPTPHLDENVAAVRWLTLLAAYLGTPEPLELAHHAMLAATKPGEADLRICPAGVLLADEEVDRAPLHITVVGPKTDARARALFLAALAWPEPFRRLEWYDPAEGPLPNPDTSFPPLTRPAAFLCSDGVCSAPVFEAEALPKVLGRLERGREEAL